MKAVVFGLSGDTGGTENALYAEIDDRFYAQVKGLQREMERIRDCTELRVADGNPVFNTDDLPEDLLGEDGYDQLETGLSDNGWDYLPDGVKLDFMDGPLADKCSWPEGCELVVDKMGFHWNFRLKHMEDYADTRWMSWEELDKLLGVAND